MIEIVLSSILIFAAALLYSSVGHAGASSYLAVMALFGTAPEVMKPAALILNILVATIGAARYYRAGYFSWPILVPFAAGSAPFAFLGGTLSLPPLVYGHLVGAALLFAAYRLWRTTAPSTAPAKSVRIIPAVGCGAGIGLLSGMTGVGGGIFLSPLLLFLRWADMKRAAGVSAAFILVNSVAGISGHLLSVKGLPSTLGYWALAATLGGAIGSHVGAKRLGDMTMRRLLGVVLVIAGAKLLLG